MFVLPILCFLVTEIAGIVDRGTINYKFEKVYLTPEGRDYVIEKHIAKYNYDENIVPFLPYSTENDIQYQHCVAGCANKNYLGISCNVAFVEDLTDNGLTPDRPHNNCYHADLDLESELMVHAVPEVEEEWKKEGPSMYKVKYLHVIRPVPPKQPQQSEEDDDEEEEEDDE